MATPMVRTATHEYPQEELEAMINFYGNKRCLISQMLVSVEWSHIMDAALVETSNPRVGQPRCILRNDAEDLPVSL